MATAAATTEAAPSRARARRRRGSGPDRLTVVLLALAGFLAVLALLAWQLSSSAANLKARPAILLHRVYETTVVETIQGPSSGVGGGSSVTQSVSSSGSSSSGAAPTTRTS